MISVLQAIILGAIQGITELFPVSSLGHSVILPAIFGWQINQSANSFVIFLIAVHFATACVLFCFFFKDWMLIFKGIFRSLKNRAIAVSDTYAKLGWLIIIATIPAGILGLLLQKKLETLFAAPEYAALFLIANGCILYGAELLRKRKQLRADADIDAGIAKISWLQSVWIGCAECLALIPGFSRTGSTLSGGLLTGLDHESAARFSFLLATPIIFAASILKLPELFSAQNIDIRLPIFFGALASALGAYCSVRFLTKYFKNKTLMPFAIYCITAGILAFTFLLFR